MVKKGDSIGFAPSTVEASHAGLLCGNSLESFADSNLLPREFPGGLVVRTPG